VKGFVSQGFLGQGIYDHPKVRVPCAIYRLGLGLSVRVVYLPFYWVSELEKKKRKEGV